jgi:dipeptidyl aminopeptidase/acylaminoacyl peptidase
MRASHCLAALALLAAGTASVSAAKRAAPSELPAFGVRDLVRLERISDPAASPDGRRIAYTLRTTDMEANKGRTSIWVLETRRRNATAVRISDPASNASAAEWSADGRFLYFLSNRDGKMQVWRAPFEGKAAEAPAAQAVTHLPLDVGSFRVSPRLDRLIVSLEVFPDCADLACTVHRLDVGAHAPAHGVLYDNIFVRHWDTWSDGRRSQLFALPLDASGAAGGEPVRLTVDLTGDVPSKPFGGREEYAISPDGAEVAFSMRQGASGEPWSTNFDIYTVPASGGTPRNLTADNPAWDGQPSYSPDGSQLAYLAMDRPGFEADRFHLVLVNRHDGAKRPLTEGWDRSISSFAWSKDTRMLFATTDHLGQRPLWAIDAGTGHAAAITGEGEVEGFSVGANRIYYTLSSLSKPADLYAVGFDGGKPRQLTRVNGALLAGRALGEPQQFSFEGWNHENVFGYVVKPAQFTKDTRYPVAFVIHGGPQGSLANLWHWRWNAQTFAGAGYAVVLIDFHGSTGYGQAFTDSISGDWGGKPLEDLKLGLAAALKRYGWLDENRMCALGGSYGGYMINWIAGQWQDRFKCLVSHDGVFDHRSMYYSTEELWFPEWEHGGPEFSNPAGYAKDNPIDHVAQWKTPMLIIHGQLDYRVPYEQGIAAFTALQRRAIPSEFLYFPDENHWVLKPGNSIEWYDTVIAWMNRWTKQ